MNNEAAQWNANCPECGKQFTKIGLPRHRARAHGLQVGPMRQLRKDLRLAAAVINHLTTCSFCTQEDPGECDAGGSDFRSWRETVAHYHFALYGGEGR